MQFISRRVRFIAWISLFNFVILGLFVASLTGFFISWIQLLTNKESLELAQEVDLIRNRNIGLGFMIFFVAIFIVLGIIRLFFVIYLYKKYNKEFSDLYKKSLLKAGLILNIVGMTVISAIILLIWDKGYHKSKYLHNEVKHLDIEYVSAYN